MSLTRRILESARSGLSQLTSLVIVDDEPLSHVEAAALDAELTARRKGRKGPPGGSAIAKLAGAGERARAERARLAEERARRVHGDRDRKDAARKAAADDAFRRMKEQAARGGSAPPPRSTGGGQASARSARADGNAVQVAEWYRTLNLSVGADLAEVKSAYRSLMRKYHPDMHAGNPQKQKAANELSLKVTAAYNGLQGHLGKEK